MEGSLAGSGMASASWGEDEMVEKWVTVYSNLLNEAIFAGPSDAALEWACG